MEFNVLSFGLLLLLKIHSQMAYRGKDPNNSDECSCGVAVPGEIEGLNIRRSETEKEDDDPYQPNQRPWLVIIEVKTKNRSIDCTGAIVSPIFIITSKSCLCFNKHGCNIMKHKKFFTNFEIKVFYGENVKKPRNSTKYIRAKKIALPPFSYNYTDILLLRLEEKITPSFEANPICLIQGNMKDENVGVVVSGYNFGKRRSKHTWCISVRGPNPRTPCKFPFIHSSNGKEEFIKECSTNVKPPAAMECKILKHTKTFLPNDIHAITIVKKEANGTKEINCFNQLNSRTYGWCGTANIDAKKGEMGYFGKDAAKNSSEPERFLKEIPRPTEESGWGFCAKSCAVDVHGNYLRENRYIALEHKHCDKMAKMKKLRRGEKEYKTYYEPKKKINKQYSSMCLTKNRELKAHNFYEMSPPPGPDIHNHTEFKKYYKTNKKKFEKVFHLLKKNTTKIYAPNEKLRLINDAGSPVFMWKKNKEHNFMNAILVGVISMSLKNRNVYREVHYNEQSTMNHEESPVLVSRVKPLMDWIKLKISRDVSHKCISYEET